MEKPKIIYLDIEDDDMYSGVEAISFVDNPAIEINWQTYNKNKKPIERFALNEVKRIVTSPVMLAETPIYRYSEELGEYYVKYSADTIFRMRNKYIMEGRQNSVNEDHDPKKKVQNVYMVESFIVGDKVKSELYPDLPSGTWVASFYITNEKYWNEKIMSGEFKGFSLEGFFIENYEMQMLNEKCFSIETILKSDSHEIVKKIKIAKVLKKELNKK